MLLDLLFVGGMRLSNTDNIQAMGEIVKICVLDSGGDTVVEIQWVYVYIFTIVVDIQLTYRWYM